jgi:hypothetical protein
MGTVTTAEALYYPLGTDFAAPRAIEEFARNADPKFSGYDTGFPAARKPYGFRWHCSANQAAQAAGIVRQPNFDVVDFDNTGGVGGVVWTQPLSDVLSWWTFAIDLLTTPTGTNQALMGSLIQVTTVDPITAVRTTSYYYNEHREHNAGGEFINQHIRVPILQGTVLCLFQHNDAVAKTINAGSWFGGWRMGPVI